VKVRINHDQSNDEYRGAGGLRMRLDRLANRLSTHICAVSVSTREFLIGCEGIDPARVSVVYNGTDPERFRKPTPEAKAAARRKFGLPEGAKVVGGVGRLNYQKNFPLFLDVAARIRRKDSNVAFVLAGDGPERRALEAQTRSLGLGDAVRFAGLVPDMTTLYPAIDLLLMPSRFEGLPLALLEAMAMEIPAVASAVDGIAEIIENGRDGLLVAPHDADGFESAACALLADPETAAAMGRAARRKVETRFSSEAMTRAVEEIYLRHLQ
jgi:glycosyltransferase involved in cell wall biosynthesis